LLVSAESTLLELAVYYQDEVDYCHTRITVPDDIDSAPLLKRNSDKEVKSLSVYPNPFQSELLVDIESSGRQRLQFDLYSCLTGINLYSEEILVHEGVNKVALEAFDADMVAGAYVLVITGTNYSKATKVICVAGKE